MTNQESTITVRHIYTDGAAPNNQNGCTLGGIGIAVLSPTNELISELSEAVLPEANDTTTNVRCEMLAVIKALELAEPKDIIHTDNKMISDGYNQWLDGWKAKGWRTANNKPVANQDLWKCIDNLKQEKTTVSITWVRGHNGVYGNELADSLATAAAS